MPPKRSFPVIEGGCCCGLVRYRLLDTPLFCYACHCSDCQKETGTVFAAACIIEYDRVASIGKVTPQVVNVKQHKHIRTIAACPNCKNIMWNTGTYAPQTYNIHIGTLDLPGLMEPDVHIFVEGKVGWLPLPKDVKQIQGDFDRAKVWPTSSLKRLKAVMERWEARKAAAAAAAVAKAQADGDFDAEDKTPTNGSPEEKDDDDEEFEKRTDEIEKALQERLEKLTLKLKEQEGGQVVEQKTT